MSMAKIAAGALSLNDVGRKVTVPDREVTITGPIASLGAFEDEATPYMLRVRVTVGHHMVSLDAGDIVEVH